MSPQPGFTHWKGNTRSRRYSDIDVSTARLHTLTRQYKKQMIQRHWCLHSPASHTDKAIQEADDTAALMSPQRGFTHWKGNTRSRWYSGIDVSTARLHTLTRQYKKQMIQRHWCLHSPASHTDKAIQEANDTVALMSPQPSFTHWKGNTRSRWYSGIDVSTAQLHTLTRQYKKQMIQWHWCLHSPTSHTDEAIQEIEDTVSLWSPQPSFTHGWGNTGNRGYSGIVVSTAQVSSHLPVPCSCEELLPLWFADLSRWGLSFLEETDVWFWVLGGLLVGHPTLGFSYLSQYGEHSVMAPCVHLVWTHTGWKNMPQGPSCRLAHRAGIISCEAPLLVVSRGGKEVVGGAKKEGQGERFRSHQGRPWQFPGLSFLPVHPCALLGLASSSGHSLLFLDHLEFCDDHVSMAPAVLAGKPSVRGTS